MNTKTTLIASAVALAAAGGLTACGGGGGGDSLAGIGGTGITTVGTIDGFGSIIVNGVHYDIDSAQIRKDGRTANRTAPNTDLRVGMLVTVKGTDHGDGTGTASQVIYRDELQGPVDAGSRTANGFQVMGVDIKVDADTRFSRCGQDDGKEPAKGMDPTADLNDGDIVEISGYRTANGIQATYVELKDSACPHDDKDEMEIKGTLDPNTGEFTPAGTSTPVNNATFFASTTQKDSKGNSCLDPFNLGISGFVELKGEYLSASKVFCVTKGESEDEYPGMDSSSDEEFEMEGLVTQVDSAAGTFRLNDSITVYYGSAVLENGLTITNNIRVEVKGSLNSDGSIAATKIERDD